MILKNKLFIPISLLLSCLLHAQKFPLVKNGKFNIRKFESLRIKETKDYLIAISDQEPNCKKVIMKSDQSKFYYCGPSHTKNSYNGTVYTEAREHTENIDGFQCIINEYYNYNSSGEITEYRKYLSKISAINNLYIESFPLGEQIFDKGQLISTRETVFTQKIHNVLIAIIIQYSREKLGMQGADSVSVSNYDNYKVTFKDNWVQLDKKESDNTEISRSSIIKAFTSLKTGFSMYRNINVTPEDNIDEWVNKL